jgi:hypothetical protein
VLNLMGLDDELQASIAAAMISSHLTGIGR